MRRVPVCSVGRPAIEPAASFVRSACMELGTSMAMHDQSYSESTHDMLERRVNVVAGADDTGLATAPPGLVAVACNVVGGTGSIGRLLGGWLSHTASAVSLTGRRGVVPPGSINLGDGSLGLVTISKRDQLAAEDASDLRDPSNDAHPKQINFFVLGVIRDALVVRMRHADLRSVVAPKRAGLAAMLDRSLHGPVECDVAFSSIVATFMNFGQANYCLANAHVNDLAEAYSTRGRTVIGVEWGPWSVGMASGLGGAMMSFGLAMIDARTGLSLLAAILSGARSRPLHGGVVGAIVTRGTPAAPADRHRQPGRSGGHRHRPRPRCRSNGLGAFFKAAHVFDDADGDDDDGSGLGVPDPRGDSGRRTRVSACHHRPFD